MQRSSHDAQATPRNPRALRVLLIDDDEDDYLLTENLLSQLGAARYDLSWAPTYEEGLDALQHGRYDVCLVDYLLGEGDGLELLRRMARRPSTPPIVFLTGNTTDGIEHEALAHGASDYLCKGGLSADALERSLRHSIERGRIISSLRESNARLRAVFEGALDAMLLADDEARYIDGNAAALSLLGVSRERLLTMRVFDVSPAELRDQTMAAWQSFIEAGSQEGDFEIRRADGTVREVEFRATANVTKGVHLSILRDLTARRKTERALRLSEARYRSLFEDAPEPILTIDAERGRVTEANASAERLFDMPRSRLTAVALSELGLDGLAVLREQSADAHPVVVERDCRGAHATVIPCEVRVATIESEHGERLLRATLTDLRERRRFEELKRSQAELEQENQRVHDSLRLRMDLFARVSHELRAPLAAILGFSELLEARVTDAKARDFVDNVLRASRHLTQLVSDVLDYARLDSGRLDFRPQRVELRPLVEEVCAMFEPKLHSKSVALAIDIHEDLKSVYTDPTRLRQVLYNYVANAAKFSARGGRVGIRIAPEPPSAFRIEVQDDGCGVAPDDVGRLFADFVQVGPRQNEPGSGLGLALTKQIVTGQGGRVGVDSTLGVGSTFFAVLPTQAEDG